MSKESELLTRRFNMAWEHIKFHAEQRIKFFHFYLITSALLINAFSILLRYNGEDSGPNEYAFLVLWIGGILSATFMGLDVRNTQLLEQSEAILRKLERDSIYGGWTDIIEVGGEAKQLPLGILSREERLKRYLRNKRYNRGVLKWFTVDNIKHKSSLRFIYIVALLSFWLTAIFASPPGLVLDAGYFQISVCAIEWALFITCVVWAGYAMILPSRDFRRELKSS